MDLETTHEIWEKLKNLYERDESIKCAKLQNFKSKYEGLKMSEDENILVYIQKVVEIVN